MNRIYFNIIRKIIFLLLLSIPSISYFSLNYSGFCFEEMRYLSQEDKVRAVFDSLNNQEKIDKIKHIKYKSFDEYLKENPDCCVVNPSYTDLPTPSQIERLFGYYSGDIVRIKYKMRYIDTNGKLKVQKLVNDSLLSNCTNRRFK
jgi:hypothetical protein